MLQSETEVSVRTAVGFLYPFSAAPRVLRFEKSKIGGLFNENQ
nr:MAG TPA: hypothetical protein [Caudoviricetes sp.]